VTRERLLRAIRERLLQRGALSVRGERGDIKEFACR
jgi:hypothetical protein